ncbi:DMT family transporter [Pseudomonas sp. MWU13-2105]|uniref:DMT family transporter n=1 Tax=Pseudomonas sp. MWU13-2105 TaxID=2935074 RepID=UPI00200D01D9|nr:DMT family transporter [Pseudomonas sp. MWU13-2105]
MPLLARAAEGRLTLSLVILASTFLMGSSFVSGKILLTEGFPPFLLVGWRFLVAAIATLPLLWLEGDSLFASLFPRHLRLKEACIVGLIGLAQTAAVMSLLFMAMRTISASTAAILLFTNPVWVALAGRVFFAEPITASRWLGLLLGVVGIVMAVGTDVSLSSDLPAVQGLCYGLGAALCWAMATLINKRNHLPIGVWALSFWQMFIGSLVVLVVAGLMGEQWPEHITASQWGWFFWLAIPASTGSFGLWFVALRQGNAGRVSGFLFFAPLFAVLLSFALLNTHLSWLQGIGGALIAFSIWLVNR